MKKMFLLGALAALGLFASCQKNESSPEQVQTAENLNVITIDTESDKAELEPLLALSEEILGINLEDRYVEKETPLIIKILRELFRSVGNFIGGNDQTPVHSFNYFGNRRSFGLAVDQIRELSYNFTESDVPYLKIQLGEASSLKIRSLEIMPVSNFYLDIQGSDRYRGKASLGKEIDSGYAEVMVSDALFVKFSYEGNSYAFTIFAEDEEATYVKAYPTDWSVFGFIFGRYDGPTLMDWYQNSFPFEEDDEIVPVSVRAMSFPVTRNIMLSYAKASNSEHRSIIIGDTGFSVDSENGEVYVEIYSGSEYNVGGDWMKASLFSDDECAVCDLWHDYLWASAFGCTQSQCNALSAEFAQVFDETDPDCNLAKLNDWYEFEGPKNFYAEVPLALVPNAASGMVWKPALGLKLPLVEGGTTMVSFAEYNAMDGARKWELQCRVKDSDGDGVPDYLDKCPGTPANVGTDEKGCPLDSDGDGVADYLDKCPGTPANVGTDEKGCPLDSDGDGVPDYLDNCPGTVAEARGMVDENGCPLDSDGDEVADYLDECPGTAPQAKGFVDEIGCPVDNDGDAVYDYEDACPSVVGTKENRGCPEE